jgi:hypothetical protein
MLVGNLINIVHAPPGFEYQFVFENIGYKNRLSLSTILSTMMLFRFYLVLRLIPNLSVWRDIQSEECCEKEGIEANH